jgi:hypothetical protein
MKRILNDRRERGALRTGPLLVLTGILLAAVIMVFELWTTPPVWLLPVRLLKRLARSGDRHGRWPRSSFGLHGLGGAIGPRDPSVIKVTTKL